MKRKAKLTLVLAVGAGLLTPIAVGYFYVRMHPLVFNESFFMHAHCMAGIVNGLFQYSSDHGGYFPSSPKGYADALAMTAPDTWVLTGPGYTLRLPESAKQGDIPEEQCGRVYVQGLKETDDPGIAILFDKKATPGGDHCHGLARLRAPLGREVLLIGVEKPFIPQSDWANFASQQIELLVKAGFAREKAQWYYDQVDK